MPRTDRVHGSIARSFAGVLHMCAVCGLKHECRWTSRALYAAAFRENISLRKTSPSAIPRGLGGLPRAAFRVGNIRVRVVGDDGLASAPWTGQAQMVIECGTCYRGTPPQYGGLQRSGCCAKSGAFRTGRQRTVTASPVRHAFATTNTFFRIYTTRVLKAG
eukprot:1187935-Prorocentrum_minimum.AAC.4